MFETVYVLPTFPAIPAVRRGEGVRDDPRDFMSSSVLTGFEAGKKM